LCAGDVKSCPDLKQCAIGEIHAKEDLMRKMSTRQSRNIMMRNLLLGTAGVSCVLMALSAGLASADTLGEAISAAYQNNPTIQRQRALQRGTNESYVQARSSLGPSLSLGTTTNYSNYNQVAPGFKGGRSASSIGFTASQNLFASGGLKSSVDSAEASVMASQQDLRSVEQQVLFSVISIYTAVRKDEEALRISQSSHDVFLRQLDETRARFEVGNLTRTDVAQAEASLSGAKARLAQAQAQLEADRATYSAIIGQAPTKLEDVPVLAKVPDSYDAALELAQKNNPDLKAELYAEDAARSNVKAARSGLGPTVSLSGTYGGNNLTSDLNNISVNEAIATLRVSVPLFASGHNASKIRQASESYNAQKMNVELARRTVVENTSQAWANLTAARTSTTAQEAQVKASGVAAEGVREEAKAGLRTTIEVLNAQIAYDNAQLDLLNARRNEYLASTQLLVNTGSLSATDFASDVMVYDSAKAFKKVRNIGVTGIDIGVKALDGLGGAVRDVVAPTK
jgi:outer membrane protein